ncbi:MAG: hypothetical protein M1830_004522 [Pleopsidium flavum]|nr:MAG: hypothetical protein M1830_004522 [Pleopsidium flavum]
MSSLSQVNQHITDTISNASIIPGFHFTLLDSPIAPEHVKEATLLCLHALIEDNYILTNAVAHSPAWLQGLSGFIGKHGLVDIAACGVLHDINSVLAVSGEDVPDGVRSNLSILKSLDAQLERHCLKAGRALEDVDSYADAAANEKEIGLVLYFIGSIAADTQMHSEAESGLDKDEFEGFADDGDMDEDVPEDRDEVDANQLDQNGTHDTSSEIEDGLDMELVTNGEHTQGALQSSSSLPSNESILGYLVNCTTPKILSILRASPDHPAESDTSSTPRNTGSSPSSSSIHGISLTALNNIAWTISITPLAIELREQWHTHAQDIWKDIIYPVLNTNTADIELASSITSLAWAISRSMNGQVTLSGDEHKNFMALYQASTSLHSQSKNPFRPPTIHQDDPTKSLSVKCIGVLGSIALCPNQIPQNRDIGTFLLTILNNLPQTPPEDAVEALNQLFDIYADKELDYDEPVFVQDGFLTYLQALQPKVQKMAKGVDKRTTPELRDRADEVVVNLGRFVKYKKEERGP